MDGFGLDLSFGSSGLSAAKDIVVIADPCDTGTSVPKTGSIHVYKLGGNSPLSFVQTIQNPSHKPGALFGFQAIGNGKQSVSTDGALIVVGTTQFDAHRQEPVQVFAKMGNNMFEQTALSDLSQAFLERSTSGSRFSS